MYKLIAIDMDGTLLDDNHQVSHDVKTTFVKAKQQGVKIVLCSGRPIVGMKPYINELNLNETDDFVIGYNGALVQNTNTEKIITEFSLNRDDLIELYELSHKLDTPMHYFDRKYLYSPNALIARHTVIGAYLNEMPIKYCPVHDFPKTNSIHDIMYVDEPEKLTETIKRIPKYFLDKYAFAQSSPHFAEFTHPQATKGNAVKKLAESLGIKQEEVMAIGDNGNDLSMIKYAGCGVAMQNAIPEVKEEADYETSSNTENGVAQAIRKFVLNEV